mmetsp:Transcript_411/g.1082  ORF Transcript_411/g.1082 Transcript_411/m.1082 type:complete len:127 (-) Transcript_411:119-499(-)
MLNGWRSRKQTDVSLSVEERRCGLVNLDWGLLGNTSEDACLEKLVLELASATALWARERWGGRRRFASMEDVACSAKELLALKHAEQKHCGSEQRKRDDQDDRVEVVLRGGKLGHVRWQHHVHAKH